MNKLHALVGVLAVGILALSLGVPAAFGAVVNGSNDSHVLKHSDRSLRSVHGSDPLALGAGWFKVENATVMTKDYFAFEFSSNQSLLSYDHLFLLARDIKSAIVSTNFTMTMFVNESAEALGWVKINNEVGFWFDLNVTDGGQKADDVFSLHVYADVNKNWVMDETTPTYTWVADGLGGGTIAVIPEQKNIVKPHDEDEENDYHDHDTDTNETNDNETNETEPVNVTAAAGGGWFMGTNGTKAFKITFGMFVVANVSLANYSHFVLQGRNVSERIQSMNFTKILVGNETLEAWGWCRANGMPGYWFHLNVTDGGSRSNDTFSLEVYKDTNGNWNMDETTPMWVWMTHGLAGGNITVGLVSELHDECEFEEQDD